jgi:hypothetical protein
VLEAVFILLEFPSPSRRIFIGSHSLPPSLVRRIGPSNATLKVDFRLPRVADFRSCLLGIAPELMKYTRGDLIDILQE